MSILHHFFDATTFMVYVIACKGRDIEKFSFSENSCD